LFFYYVQKYKKKGKNKQIKVLFLPIAFKKQQLFNNQNLIK